MLIFLKSPFLYAHVQIYLHICTHTFVYRTYVCMSLNMHFAKDFGLTQATKKDADTLYFFDSKYFILQRQQIHS